ncbi:MAG: C25 family cysteine peptidase [Bacteroidetes bacterium]|nr:C25 family cysteine peptidase [Bacteroidota bacterium]
MKRSILFILLVVPGLICFAGNIEKTYYFSDYRISTTGSYQRIVFENTQQSALPGEPSVPYRAVVLMLPPGESAESIEIIRENETAIPGGFILYPQQPPRTFSDDTSYKFIRNEAVYRLNRNYPDNLSGHLMTQYLNGYAFAISTFTPVNYNPAMKKVSFFSKVTVKIKTRKDPASSDALRNLVPSADVNQRVRNFAQNPELMQQYKLPKSPATDYHYLIITPAAFQYEFTSLISMYNGKSILCQVKTTEDIYATMSGYDNQEKIRNYIQDQYTNSHIKYVLLAGTPTYVPARKFYCHVISGGGYTSNDIPSDLYYSGMDGNYDSDGDHIYAETNDNPDLVPEISVARFPVNNTTELQSMIHKTIWYQTNPVFGEMKKPLLAGEYLWANPLTYGGPYLDMMIDNHSNNGYYTHGIPSATNNIEKLYDAPGYSWSTSSLIAKINEGKSFIHHVGHANSGYVMRLYTSDIYNENFSQVDGIIHNYQILYSQGCDDGAFDVGGCISVKAVTITNFLAAAIVNSRYGWFNEGTTDGPSEHLEREFVSALYDDVQPERHIGTAHMISKIKTVPWVDLPGEYEFGAQRWVHYDCNVLGDPAMEIWTDEPTSFSTVTWTGNEDNDWNKAGNWSTGKVPTTLYDVTIPNVSNLPVITTNNTTFCHDVILQNGGTLTVESGKSIIIQGSLILNGSK